MSMYTDYGKLALALRDALNDYNFFDCPNLDEKVKLFSKLLKEDKLLRAVQKKMFYNRVNINEYLIVIFIKEILSDYEREEYYSPYDISVQRHLTQEELRPKNYTEFLTQEATEELAKRFDVKFDKNALKYKPEIQNVDKYFNGTDGLTKRLKDAFLDIEDFDEAYKDTPEYKSQRLRLLFLFYYTERRMDLSEMFNTVNTALMLKKTTMENADLTLVDIRNTNGKVYHELREQLFWDLNPLKRLT